MRIIPYENVIFQNINEMTTFIGSDDSEEQIKRSRDMDLFCGHRKILEHDMIMFGMNEYLEN